MSLKISHGGKLVKIPILGGVGINNLYSSEIWLLEIIKRLSEIKKGAFFDIGVNIGQTLIKLKSIDSEVEYFGFEPNPSCVYYVNRLIIENSYKNTRLFPVGIHEFTEILKLHFYQDDQADSSASIIKNYRAGKEIREEFVPCFNHETLIRSISFKKIAIMKIDVEGAELEVLKGIQPFLVSDRPFIIVELLPVYSLSNTGRLIRQKEVEKLLLEMGYTIFRIIKNKQGSLKKIKLVEEIGIHSNIDLCDYLCSPKEFSNIFND